MDRWNLVRHESRQRSIPNAYRDVDLCRFQFAIANLIVPWLLTYFSRWSSGSRALRLFGSVSFRSHAKPALAGAGTSPLDEWRWLQPDD
jgi:hypothetical protein